jgi:PIN domain nuclease of toxin-antitoxin system
MNNENSIRCSCISLVRKRFEPIIKKAKELIEDETNQLVLSVASLWEISIKFSIEKLEIKGGYSTVWDDIMETGIEILPLNFIHTLHLSTLPFHHKDPFDRILIVQAFEERMDIISSAGKFDKYLKNAAVRRLW